VLPAQTYVKGFLRSYADYLGLDGQLYVDEFNSRYVRGELEEEEEQRPYKPRVASPSRGSAFQSKAVLLTLAIIAGLTIFVFAAAKWGGRATRTTCSAVTRRRSEEARAEARGEARRGGDQRRRVRRRLSAARAPGGRSTRARSRTASGSASWGDTSGCTSSRRRTCG
jgi:cytoskeletal protein RodZ